MLRPRPRPTPGTGHQRLCPRRYNHSLDTLNSGLHLVSFPRKTDEFSNEGPLTPGQLPGLLISSAARRPATMPTIRVSFPRKTKSAPSRIGPGTHQDCAVHGRRHDVSVAACPGWSGPTSGAATQRQMLDCAKAATPSEWMRRRCASGPVRRPTATALLAGVRMPCE